MSRPAFSLTDAQARALSLRTAELQELFPLDPRNHRPFVRAFLRAVQEITGNLYSPAIYHRLLSAYAQDRRPSTSTLAAEKQALANEVALMPTTVATLDEGDDAPRPLDDSGALRAVVAEVIESTLLRVTRGTGQADLAQVNFYASRLREAEVQVRDLRVSCARLTAELEVAHQAIQAQTQEAEGSARVLSQHLVTVAKLTGEVSDIRTFALQSIDEARSEARAWKERYAAIEAQRQKDLLLLETFRQQAYRHGASIPPSLSKDKIP